MERFPPAAFQLPEPVLSRKTSTTSLGQSVTSTVTGSMAEIMGPNGPKTGLIRRVSNKVKNRAAHIPRPGRRQSSVHPVSRDGSVGPGIIRRGRSGSNVTAPEHGCTDSEEEFVDEKDDRVSLFGGDTPKDYSPISAAVSVTTPTTAVDVTAGPVIPLALLQGTWISKVSKKSRKRVLLSLEPEAGKFSWDRNRPSKCVYIDDIKEIRVYPDISQSRKDCGIPESDQHLFFSILYAIPDKSMSKTMHLVADDEETFTNWVSTLDAISKHRQDLMSSLMAFNDKAIRAYWQKEMGKINSDRLGVIPEEEIDFSGVERVCRNLHIHVPEGSLRAKFNEADRSGTKRLSFAEFQEFVRLMKRREDVRALYREVASDIDSGMTWTEFLDFLRDVQGEVIDDSAPWEAVFAKFSRRYRPKDAGKLDNGVDETPRMSEAALAGYLTSTYNPPLVKAPQEYSLDRPMNEYFISSSHNTYLLGRQVAGNSSVEGYISALMRGCRCVEVDCWDGPDLQPIVVHGRTLTTQIQFREVINAINKYAFERSEFPLWISLEVHCNPVQQAVMTSIMVEIFGDKLVRETLDGFTDQLPPPSALKGRILIKVKKPQAIDDFKNGDVVAGRKRGNSLTSPYTKPVSMDNSPIPNSPLLSPSYSTMRRSSSNHPRVDTITEGEVQEPASSSTSDDSGEERGPTTKAKQSKITKVLGDLGVYCLGIKFRGFDDAECKSFNHILSFKERTFLKNSESKVDKRALYRHNMRHLMRVYPNQTRITSSNFDPLIYWRRGVQMAALNWQTFDFGMQLNRAMFDGGTDQSGYVLKPSEFREIQVMPNLPGEWIGKRERKNVSFSIDVISAQQLMRPANLGERRTLDPYVEVEVYLADDKRDKKENNGQAQPSRTPQKCRTQVIRENGFNPIFDKKFTFNFTTKYPDLVFIRWSVKLSQGENQQDRSPPMATFTAKLSSLKQGYRTLPLLDHNGDRYLFSTLFCRIKVDPITSVFVDYTEDGDNVNRLRSLGRTVFNRSSNISPKSSMDSGLS